VTQRDAYNDTTVKGILKMISHIENGTYTQILYVIDPSLHQYLTHVTHTQKFLYNNYILIRRLNPILRTSYCFFMQTTSLWTIIS